MMAALGVVFVLACTAEGSPEPVDESEDEDSTPVAGYELEPRDLSKVVRTSGTVEPRERIRIKSPIGGVLKTLSVEEGDSVRRGELLAKSELSEMRAELRRAQAQVDAYQRRYDRRKPLADRDAVRQDEVEELQSSIEIAESEVELWQTRIELSKVSAPRDAVVTARHVT